MPFLVMDDGRKEPPQVFRMRIRRWQALGHSKPSKPPAMPDIFDTDASRSKQSKECHAMNKDGTWRKRTYRV